MTNDTSRADALTEITARMQALTALKKRTDSMPIMYEWQWLNTLRHRLIAASRVDQPAAAPTHLDDAAVDRFAFAMKAKLADARQKGRSGWEQCDPAVLSQMLRDHVDKGDPRDVANFCAFLWSLGMPITASPAQQVAAAANGLKARLRRVIDLLDSELGDSDAMVEGMTQEEIEEECPVFAATQIVVALHQETLDDNATARTYPDELTDALRYVLGFPNFSCAPYAQLMRNSGAKILTRSEDEQAHVLHWLVKLVLDHGAQWADVAEEELKAMRAQPDATHGQEATR
ncbi:hypothetical protein [Burkholderia stagnalis]|uniref:hypothetical protein n=1 Tax=Burkholderia stagnalis TaxID=1503054 RepID=UPI000841F839|nr:hypothetical protein [Burkholderia stagnalis]AOK53478.1 hypothetical protein WT74_12675 [Burkholderia stagnalis]